MTRRSPLALPTTALLVTSLLLSCRSTPKQHAARDDPSLSLQRFEYAGEHGGRATRITLYAPDAETADSAAGEAFARADAIAGVIDARRSDSDLARLNASAGELPVMVSDELFALLLQADHLARYSDGAFDPTIGPFLDLWRAATAVGRLPAREAIDGARPLVGRDKLRVEPISRTVQLTEPGMRIDLDALASGYTADQMFLVLHQRGIDRALVEVGDTVLLGNPPPARPGWRVELLGVPPQSPQRFITLANAALSSAGREESTVQIAGARYAADVIDPATGLGPTGGLAVTVIAHNGIAADALASAALVLGPQKSRPLLRIARAGAYFRRGATAVEMNPPPMTTQPADENSDTPRGISLRVGSTHPFDGG